MTKETILYATKIGEPSWAEQIITTDKNKIDAATLWAASNGFDRLRIVEVDMSVEPNFTSTLNRAI